MQFIALKIPFQKDAIWGQGGMYFVYFSLLEGCCVYSKVV